MTAAELQEIAEYFCELFKRYSTPPVSIDRQDPAYRVSTSDLTARFPRLSIVDLPELNPYIKQAMRKHGLSFKEPK